MLVTVVIPCHNYGRFLREAIESVCNQSVTDLELIVVDDGSTDETPQVLAEIADPRLRTVRITNAGVSAARNIGLDLATGEFIAFLDADDRWLPAKLEKQLNLFHDEPELGLVFSNFARFNDQGTFPRTHFDFISGLSSIPSRETVRGGIVLTGDTFISLMGLRLVATWVQTVLMRRDLVRDLRFPPRHIVNEDFHYMARVYPRVHAGFFTEPLVEVRRHGNNSYESGEEKERHDLTVLRDLLSEPLIRSHREALKRRIGMEYLSKGYAEYWKGSATAAAWAYLHALQYPGSRSAALRYLGALPLRPLLRKYRMA